jgi:GT2 family glycosyltransferase
MADISIIIVNYNGSGFIEDCLESIGERLAGEENPVSYEVIIMDNASSDGSPEYLKKFCSQKEDFRLIENNRNIGFGAASNKGAKQAKGDFLLFLNPDCRILESGMNNVLHLYREKKDAGALGVKILNSDGSLQFSCRAFPTLARQFYESFFCYRIFRSSRMFGSYFMTWWDHSTIRAVDWLSGSFILIKKKVFEDLNGFDEDYFMYSEDTDLCLRLVREGYKNYYYPGYIVEHADAGIASRDKAQRIAEIWKSHRLYFRKNHTKVHSLIFSFLYFLGVKNRLLVSVITLMFSSRARKNKRTQMYLKGLKLYFCKKGIK